MHTPVRTCTHRDKSKSCLSTMYRTSTSAGWRYNKGGFLDPYIKFIILLRQDAIVWCSGIIKVDNATMFTRFRTGNPYKKHVVTDVIRLDSTGGWGKSNFTRLTALSCCFWNIPGICPCWTLKTDLSHCCLSDEYFATLYSSSNIICSSVNVTHLNVTHRIKTNDSTI